MDTSLSHARFRTKTASRPTRRNAGDRRRIIELAETRDRLEIPRVCGTDAISVDATERARQRAPKCVEYMLFAEEPCLFIQCPLSRGSGTRSKRDTTAMSVISSRHSRNSRTRRDRCCSAGGGRRCTGVHAPRTLVANFTATGNR